MKKQWQRLTDGLIGGKNYFLVDASVYSFFTILKYYIDKYAKGIVLDAGAGRLALKFLFTKKAGKYYSIDKYIARKDLNIVGNLNCLPLKEKSFDTIICLQVIEHTATPGILIKNLVTSLKENGILIISAPHISYLHGEPEDYYRFTKYGLSYLLESSGLKVLENSAAGSLFGYLCSLLSDVILSYAYEIPFLFKILFFFNSLISRIISKVDSILFKNSILAINYIVVAKMEGKS